MSARATVSVLYCLFISSTSVFASDITFGPRTPIPENARVVLSADRDEYFLGENILVHFELENTGGPAFEAEFGGDYRGASRHLRFSVTATDTSGQPVADPNPSTFCMGGIGGPLAITPEKPYYQSLPILRYLLFEEPGTYVVTVRHDCGWEETADRKYPEASITLRLKRPSPAQASELVEAWLAAPPHQGIIPRKKSDPHADFSVIRYAEYLEPLARHAAEGSENALVGVGSIATPEATAVLVDLLDTADDDFGAKVCRQLGARLPDPYLEGLLGKRNAFENDVKTVRRRMVEQSWRREFSDEIRGHAARFLADERKEWVATGAFFMECVGQPSDAVLVEQALDREVRRTLTLEFETQQYPRPRGACQELLRAAQVLLARGAPAPTRPVSDGQAMFFLLALTQDETFRPDGWLETCDRLLRSDISYIQEQTLIALPAPMPEPLRKHLTPILASGNVDAAIEACRIIQRDKLHDQKDVILNICRSAREEWLFRAAGNALHALGAGYEHLEVLVTRLDEANRLFDRLDRLRGIVFDNTGGASSGHNVGVEAEAQRIKPLWQAFIRAHEERLRAGRRFTLPDPNVPAEMFPTQYSITLKDGQRWP
jgi:hypothetical protein